MTRTGERTTVTREAVPDVALTLSADHGYHGTALNQIAEALELRIPSPCNHMKSQHSLLTASASGRRYPHDSHAGFATDQPPAVMERITRIGTVGLPPQARLQDGCRTEGRVHSWRQNAATPSD